MAGPQKTALSRINTVILSQSKAQLYFGDTNPVGQTIKIDNRYDLEVTGVFENLPANTHLPFGVIGSFQTIPFGQPERLSWGNASFLYLPFITS